jgi:hypothetical protein
MTIGRKRMDYYPLSGSVMIISADPGVCGSCHKPRFSFVNRAGETRCLSCDDEAQKSQLAKGAA